MESTKSTRRSEAEKDNSSYTQRVLHGPLSGVFMLLSHSRIATVFSPLSPRIHTHIHTSSRRGSNCSANHGSEGAGWSSNQECSNPASPQQGSAGVEEGGGALQPYSHSLSKLSAAQQYCRPRSPPYTAQGKKEPPQEYVFLMDFPKYTCCHLWSRSITKCNFFNMITKCSVCSVLLCSPNFQRNWSFISSGEKFLFTVLYSFCYCLGSKYLRFPNLTHTQPDRN